MTHKVTFFKSCDIHKGQKIRFKDSYLKGDWEIVDMTKTKVTLRCPISNKELVKDRFFYFTGEKQDNWPEE